MFVLVIESADVSIHLMQGGVKLNQGPKNTNLAYSDAGFYELEVMLGPLRRKASFHLTVQGKV